MDCKRYRVTDTAGPWVAGKRVNAGDLLDLRDDEAEYELARGQIEAVVAPEITGVAGDAESTTVDLSGDVARDIETSPHDMAIRFAPNRRRGE